MRSGENAYQKNERPSTAAARDAAVQSRSAIFQLMNDRHQSDRLLQLQSAMNGSPRVQRLTSLVSAMNGVLHGGSGGEPSPVQKREDRTGQRGGLEPADRNLPVPLPVAHGLGTAQLMPADEIKVGKWYRISGVEGPRYLKTRRFPQGGDPSWEFYTHPLGLAKGEAPLVVDGPEKILEAVAEPPAARAEEWGKGVSDHKIFGLDSKNKAAVMEAIRVGYRCFDAAKTYALSAADLASACSEANLARKDYKVIYKVGHGTTKVPLNDVIQEALGALQYIDILMVHESTEHLAANIRTINKYVAEGLVKAGGLSNVAGFDLEEMDETELRHMVMLQDSVDMLKQVHQAGPDARAKEKLEAAGVKVKDSVYGLHRGITFSPEESEVLRKLNLNEAQALTIWALHYGIGEVASSSNPEHIAQNFQTPRVSGDLANVIVTMIDSKLSPPQEAQQEAAVEDSWNVPGLKEIHQSATVNAQSNNLEAFLGALSEIAPRTGIKGALLKHWPLKLTSHDVSVNNIYKGITWQKLLSGDPSLGSACNVRDLLLSIAGCVKQIDKDLAD